MCIHDITLRHSPWAEAVDDLHFSCSHIGRDSLAMQLIEISDKSREQFIIILTPLQPALIIDIQLDNLLISR